jgi:hypothetical protein
MHGKLRMYRAVLACSCLAVNGTWSSFAGAKVNQMQVHGWTADVQCLCVLLMDC